MYNMVTIVNNIVLYHWNLLREYILSVLNTHTRTQKVTKWDEGYVN